MLESASKIARVLIVDDEEMAVENLAHVCRKEGYEVTTRMTGMGALEILEKYPPRYNHPHFFTFWKKTGSISS